MARLHCWRRRPRVLHLSPGPAGSAVAGTLATLAPRPRDLGRRAEWQNVGDAETRQPIAAGTPSTGLAPRAEISPIRGGPRDRDPGMFPATDPRSGGDWYGDGESRG